MKTRITYLCAIALLAVSVISCNKDDVSPPEEPYGDDTYMTIRFIGSAATYAEPDPNATPDEINIESADVFIYPTGGGSLTHRHVEKADITLGTTSNTWNAEFKVATTTGEKTVFVGINLPNAIVENIKSNGYSASFSFENVATLIGQDKKAFSMFSQKGVTETMVDDPDANLVKVDVDRLTSKISVLEANSLVKTNITGANIGDMQFALGSVNKKIYPLQNKDENTGVVTDPNFIISSTDILDPAFFNQNFYNEFTLAADGKYWDSGEPHSYVNVQKRSDISEIGDIIMKYAPENTSGSQLRGELTYASIKAKFTPIKIHKYVNDDLEDETVSGGQSFPDLYVVSTLEGVYYYFPVEADANKFLETHSGTLDHYKNQECFYHPIINRVIADEVENHNLFRNHYYDINITKIHSLGFPGPGITDPDKPISKQTSMTIEVTFVPWTKKSYDDELGKN